MTTTQLRLTTTTTTRRPAARVSASLRVVCQAAQPARVSRRNVALALPALSGLGTELIMNQIMSTAGPQPTARSRGRRRPGCSNPVAPGS
jgi:hypothetical protein